MGEESMINALRLLRHSTQKNKTQRMRDLYDEVEALKESGFSHARIFEELKTNNLNFKSVQAFEVTFYRVKKERALSQNRIGTTRLEKKTIRAMTSQTQTDKTDGSTCVKAATEQKYVTPGRNPLHALARKPTEGDFNHIPKAKFEVDDS